jgi:hypothetical protein
LAKVRLIQIYYKILFINFLQTWQLTLNNLPEAPSVAANFHLARYKNTERLN